LNLELRKCSRAGRRTSNVDRGDRTIIAELGKQWATTDFTDFTDGWGGEAIRMLVAGYWILDDDPRGAVRSESRTLRTRAPREEVSEAVLEGGGDSAVEVGPEEDGDFASIGPSGAGVGGVNG
jgi:hypothetical protein